jgi:heme b synthase
MIGHNQPRLIFWELTKRCNLRCIHCRAEAFDIDDHDELPTRSVKKILTDIAEFYRPVMVFTGGEPLYRSDLFDVIHHAYAKGLATAIATNGTMIDEAVAAEIKAVKTGRVSVSLDGSSARLHDVFRGIKGSFDLAVQGIDFLKKAGVEFQINTTFTKKNINDAENMLRLCESLGAKAFHLFMLVPVGCGLLISDTDMISSAEYEDLLSWFCEIRSRTKLELRATCAPHYYRILKQKSTIAKTVHGQNNSELNSFTKGCLAGSGVCFISHTGDVQPCGYLPLVAGNLGETHFKEIWEKSELFISLRDTARLLGNCGVCEYKNICGGCRARAYHASGNYLDSEPFCVHMPSRKGN